MELMGHVYLDCMEELRNFVTTRLQTSHLRGPTPLVNRAGGTLISKFINVFIQTSKEYSINLAAILQMEVKELTLKETISYRACNIHA